MAIFLDNPVSCKTICSKVPSYIDQIRTSPPMGSKGTFLTMNKSPDFQETLKRMLETPPKENKPLNQDSKKGESKTRPKK